MLDVVMVCVPFVVLVTFVLVLHFAFKAERKQNECKTCGQPFCLKDHAAPGRVSEAFSYPRPGGGYCPFGEHWDPWG